jgi:hypothetical protein
LKRIAQASMSAADANWTTRSTGCSWPVSDCQQATHTCQWRFSGPLTGVLCKRPFAEFIAKIRIRWQRSLQGIYQRAEKLELSGRVSKQGGRANDSHQTVGDPQKQTVNGST